MYIISREDFSTTVMMQQLVDLQNKVYSGKHIFTKDTFQYWYLDNPNGKVVSFNAFFENHMVAHYALIPIQMKVHNKIINGLLSMATVTDPDHQGKGLFKKLAKETYDYAASLGYKFVIGIANANSYPGFIKYFNFQDVGKLDVMLGFSNNIKPSGDKTYSIFWNEKSLLWRISKKSYKKDQNRIYGTVGFWKFKKIPGVKTFMGTFFDQELSNLPLPTINNFIRPLNLYIGMGSNAEQNGYLHLPKFIKRSPFHLIFLDLTNGELPKINKDNIFFQLIDFDVA